MLVWLLEEFAAGKPAEWAWAPAVARALAAAWLCLLATLVLAPRWLAFLGAHFREPLKTPCAAVRALHRHKENTPTMGGLIIVGMVLLAVLLLADVRNGHVQAAVCIVLGLAAVGMMDDLHKLRRAGNGLRPMTKLLLGIPFACAAAWLIYAQHRFEAGGLSIWLPFAGEVDLGAWYVLLGVLVMLCSAHSVNLTDGLDGLAGGCVLVVLGCLGLVVWMGIEGWSVFTIRPWGAGLGPESFSGPRTIVGPAGMVPLAAGAETLVVAGATFGSVAAFLWFNCHPARVFMGDTGALSLGGLLAVLALANRLEWLLLAAGGVFVVEAGSVVVQVVARRVWGRRWLRCAPLHHHFELGGWPEKRVVWSFWMAAVLCAAVGLGITQAVWRTPWGARAAMAWQTPLGR